MSAAARRAELRASRIDLAPAITVVAIENLLNEFQILLHVGHDETPCWRTGPDGRPDQYIGMSRPFNETIRRGLSGRATGGGAWNLNILRNGGLHAESFTSAFVAGKVGEIITQPPAVPEPTTWGLACTGLLVAGWVARRQRRGTAAASA